MTGEDCAETQGGSYMQRWNCAGLRIFSQTITLFLCSHLGKAFGVTPGGRMKESVNRGMETSPPLTVVSPASLTRLLKSLKEGPY